MPAVDSLSRASFVVFKRVNSDFDSFRVLGQGNSVPITTDLAHKTLRDGEPAFLKPARSSQRNSVDNLIEAAFTLEPAIVVEESFWHVTRGLQACRDVAPNPEEVDLHPSEALLKWLQRLQFKMAQIELQSSQATTQFYSI